ncbi:hypothetical protein BWQ96_04148 [Gracilariopsis chorda]|uniref:CDAN1-interacting nuclease 1 n=1 Tax=Gracilariopsis chorda TaxID=448386 RepID=A0A2V3IVI7_9FLOR|nr:hypothetical protein BWQ96_04148 [Gracilariopsis chorda]|eukprot:PXF46142.1 hypothetical protein BWQ96_04148 [Gracilariopsis chorda]
MLNVEWLSLCSSLRCKEDISRIAREQPHLSHDTIALIYEQLYTRQVARTFYQVKLHGKTFVKNFKNGQSLLDIAESFNLSPVLVARKVMELHLGLNRKLITQALREPSMIGDERLRADVCLCIELDEHCSPRTDRLRHALGLEYELRLRDEVKNCGFEFETEDDLRNRGCHKTPDILLRVPISFRNKVIRWIDSKAKFGDKYTLNQDYTSSVSSYIGRFGPGMVIYWFGFIEDCDSGMLNDNGLVVMDRFPTEIETLPGSSRFSVDLLDEHDESDSEVDAEQFDLTKLDIGRVLNLP